MGTRTALSMEAFLALPDTEGKQELDEGELIEMPPTQKRHGLIGGRILSRIDRYLEHHPIGIVTMNDGFRLAPDIMRVPDVAFVSAARDNPDEPGYYEGAPDLAIEVVSPSETATQINRKVKQYLATGGVEVWVIYPADREVHVWRQSGLTVVREPGALDGGAVLPGFRLPLSELFA